MIDDSAKLPKEVSLGTLNFFDPQLVNFTDPEEGQWVSPFARASSAAT